LTLQAHQQFTAGCKLVAYQMTTIQFCSLLITPTNTQIGTYVNENEMEQNASKQSPSHKSSSSVSME